MRANLRAWYDRATDAERLAGRDWYPMARAAAERLAGAHGTSVETAAAVIAVTSPRCAWPDNVSGADAIMRAHRAGETLPAPAGMLGPNVAKAGRILADADAGRQPQSCDGRMASRRDPSRTVACDRRCGALVHGPKVAEFFRTILGALDGRTMDVWATRAADVAPADVDGLAPDSPRRAGIPGARMALLQAAYAAVAHEVGETPAALQAGIWIAIRGAWRRSDGRINGRRD